MDLHRPTEATGVLVGERRTPTLTVVVPAFDEEDTIAACLDRLATQDRIDEIVVVDNNSTDRTVETVLDFAERHPKIRLIHEAEQGLVYARNAGMDAATGDLIARIDSDTMVGEHWSRTIVDFFAADVDRTWSALCGRGEAYDVPLSGRFDKWKIKLHPLGDRRSSDEVKEIPVLYGSNMVVRREVWHRIRTRVSMRRDIFEDVDMGLCIQDDGGRNAFLASLTVGVSPRRMQSSLPEFTRYMSFLPRTFALHRRFAYTAGTALIYVPALTVLHTGRLLMLRLYDSETGQLTPSRLTRRSSVPARVLP
ncbi:MAG: glycosyltransferase family 2 protein [Rhodococcus sp. (in: high G+C Gram-positive bacteria)]|uniref:glycosyltransferase n=1 Tax=Rhodococcus sp. TaxID=1831 RepID=UPI002AD763FD|nr:glycosyltransferase family 2 protein [Rhodococcus sp. (in: high G+C Gram-positive bacteria)]MDZ7930480.1 glycosyltransferase family 2 protein [Rhodococcus sp. (in: high G+C Gram-positive bacteria)]